jgi:hypothetical protein
VPGAAFGKVTFVRISSASRAVVKYPTKKSAALIVRVPRVLVASKVASRASAIAGSSAAGSA